MKSKKPKDLQVINVAEEVGTYAKDVTGPIFDIAARLETKLGPGVAEYFLGCLVATLIAKSVEEKLTTGAKGVYSTKEQRVEEAMQRLRAIKGTMQEAVSAGFSGGMSAFAGKDIEYYCQIKEVPMPLSKERN